MMIRFLFPVVACLAVVMACGGDGGSPPAETSGTAIATQTAGTSSPSAGDPTPTASPAALTYTVEPGDTLGAIAERFGVTVDAIAAANGIEDPAAIQIGQVLVIAGGQEPLPTQPPKTDGGGQTPGGEVSILRLVDKQHALPSSYVPPDLKAVPAQYRGPAFGGSVRSETLLALVAMLDAAAGAGHEIGVVSAYRSYSQQETTFQYWVNTLGYDEAVRVSAMAGHSEHQLGTTVDLSTADAGWKLEEAFGGTPAGQWLEAHAHEYGFALSYPAGAEAITGYAYEPWHFRFIGETEASAWKASGLTLNQYLGG